MPQIWPMNWVLLFFYFMMTFIFFIVTVYFTSSVKLPSKTLLKGTLVSKYLSWMW